MVKSTDLEIIICRHTRTKDRAGIFGTLWIEETIVCNTLELDWNNNKAQQSCIPVGQYVTRKHKSPKFGRCFKILRVPSRTHILIHAGNYTRDTTGCVLVGSSINPTSHMLKESRKALGRLYLELPDIFKLKIVSLYHD